jgi:hypothetical protein
MCAAVVRFNHKTGRDGAISADLPPRGNPSSIMQTFSTAQYDLLTSVVKPITTALWHCCGNRAATAWGE